MTLENFGTAELLSISGRYFRNDVMVCLGSVPRGHTGDVRFILDCFSQKRGKLLVTITVLPALDILIFPNEYVFRQSIYRRKRFTSF